ncbi:MAG: tetratricopeptide repeat protein [Bacteroidia bacterium]
MLRTKTELKWDTGKLPLNERNLGYVFLGLYAILSLLWAFSCDAPWDDDCPNRFLNTRRALSEPEQFISVWNRPLFVLIFALPSQLGKDSVAILMTLISTLGAWLLWRAVDALKSPNAWLVIALYAFQPFFYGTSRVALTEPLAATLVCAGFYFLVSKKWAPYALMGGLLPLARLELSVLLLIWLVPIVKERQFRSLVWMAAPLVLWNVAGGIITGDFNYVFNQSFGQDKGVNRYGHTGFWHYFERYFYVTGPVVAILLTWGLFLRAKEKGLKLWIDGQFALGFLLYVVFSWKLSLGNAAGYLRNLVPLAPLVALVALDGMNRGLAVFSGPAQGKAGADQKTHRILLGLVTAAGLFVAWRFFSRELALHHHPVPRPDFAILGVMGAFLVAAAGIYWYQNRKGSGATSMAGTSQLIGLAGAVLAAGYTLVKEPPDASDNEERQAMGMIANFFSESNLRDRPTYVNHAWFFWSSDLNPADKQFQTVTMNNLDAAAVGSVVVWDVHFCTRLGGDVLPSYFQVHPEFVELARLGHPDRNESVILYEKTTPDSLSQARLSESFAKANEKYLPALLGRAFYLMTRGHYREAMVPIEYGLSHVQSDPELWFAHGFCLMQMGRYTEAVPSFQNATAIKGKYPLAWLHLGTCLYQMHDLKGALTALNRSVVLQQESPQAYFARASVRAAMRDMEGAIADYGMTIRLQPNHPKAYTDRAAAYALLGELDLARADIAVAAKMRPGDPQVIFVQGRILSQSGDKATGCALMQQAVALGLVEAKAYVDKQCADFPAAPAQPK